MVVALAGCLQDSPGILGGLEMFMESFEVQYIGHEDIQKPHLSLQWLQDFDKFPFISW